jgi:hypothetical protein
MAAPVPQVGATDSGGYGFEREGVRFGVKVRQLAEMRLLRETLRFLIYAEKEAKSMRIGADMLPPPLYLRLIYDNPL